MQLEKLLPITFYYSISKCKMKLLTDGIREILMLSYTIGGFRLDQQYEQLSQWDSNGFSPGNVRVQGNYLMLDKLPSGKRGVLGGRKAAGSTMVELLWSCNRTGARKLLECGNNQPGKYIQSMSLALQKTDFVLSDALQLLCLWSSPQIKMAVLHFDAAEKAIDKLQLRSNILDFIEEQQADLHRPEIH